MLGDPDRTNCVLQDREARLGLREGALVGTRVLLTRQVTRAGLLCRVVHVINLLGERDLLTFLHLLLLLSVLFLVTSICAMMMPPLNISATISIQTPITVQAS